MAKVLIAEDELMIADMIADVLVENGYDICGIARSVAEAIELGEARRPDLAVIDLHLADGSLGTAIAHRLRLSDSLGVLYMTGGANDMALTANDGEACLRKPFALRNLVAALKIVEQIVNGTDAAPPFPSGFELRRHPPEQRMPESPEMTAANLKIARLLDSRRAGGARCFAFRNGPGKRLIEAAQPARMPGGTFCKIRRRPEENDLLARRGSAGDPASSAAWSRGRIRVRRKAARSSPASR
jgi:CheY-like chemotaxis protein